VGLSVDDMCKFCDTSMKKRTREKENDDACELKVVKNVNNEIFFSSFNRKSSSERNVFSFT